MTNTDRKPWYLCCPGGYFAIENAPGEDAAHDLAQQMFGPHAVADWALTPTRPTSLDQFTSLDWPDLSHDAWMDTPGWEGLLTLLTGSIGGFSDPDLRALVTEHAAQMTAAVLRIAAEELRRSIAHHEANVYTFGIKEDSTDLPRIYGDPASYLESEADRHEQNAKGLA